jgi:hypothetical protein
MPNGAMVEGSSSVGREKTKAWRTAVAEGAHRAARGGIRFTGPVQVTIAFRFPIVRATLDGLVDSGILAGDQLVWALRASKTEVTSWSGAVIWIHPEGEG